MGLLSDILLRYLNPTPADAEVIAKELAQLNNRTEAQTRTMGSTGAARGSYSNNVSVGDSEGIFLTSPFTGKKTIWLEPDGDAFFGADLDKPSQTSLIIFSNDQLYNRENLAFGDVLLGDNSANRANLLWDRSTGRLNFRGGTTTQAYIDTNGKLFAQLADIGGWNVDATRIYSDGNEIVLDSANLRIEVGSSDEVIIDGDNGQIRSGDFASGVTGWRVGGPNDDAEFNNITARGVFRTSVFNYGEIQGSSGTIAVFDAVGRLNRDHNFLSTGTSSNLYVDKDDNGNRIFEVNDIVRMKGWNGDAIVQFWGYIQAILDDTDPDFTRYQVYSASISPFTVPTLFVEGMAVVGYGTYASNSGIIYLSADGTIGSSANITIATHTGQPWNSEVVRVRLGNMRDSYGAGSNDRYGVGIGDYSGGNYLSYNAEEADGFVLKAGGGSVVLDDEGISLSGSGAGSLSRFLKFYDTSGTPARLGYLVGDWGGTAGDQATMWLVSEKNAGDPWVLEPQIILLALDNTGPSELRFTMGLDTKLFQFSGPSGTAINFGGNKIANASEYNGDFTITGGNLRLDNNKQIQAKDPGGTYRNMMTWDSTIDTIYIGESGGSHQIRFRPGGAEAMMIDTNGRVGIGTSSPISNSVLDVHGSVAGLVRNYFQNDNTGASSRSDIAIRADNGSEDIYLGVDKPGTAYGTKAYLDNRTSGDFAFYQTGTEALRLAANGDVYTVPWTDYSATSTVVGWSSFTTKLIGYKKIGKLVFVNFQLDGTSNSTSISFTLPHNSGMTSVLRAPIQAIDNGVSQSSPGLARLGVSPDGTVICDLDWAGTGWTASGTKRVRGQFVYEAA